jgi:hypothetical protein
VLGFGRALFLHKKAVSKIVASVPSFSLSLLSQIHKFLAENWLVSTLDLLTRLVKLGEESAGEERGSSVVLWDLNWREKRNFHVSWSDKVGFVLKNRRPKRIDCTVVFVEKGQS